MGVKQTFQTGLVAATALGTAVTGGSKVEAAGSTVQTPKTEQHVDAGHDADRLWEWTKDKAGDAGHSIRHHAGRAGDSAGDFISNEIWEPTCQRAIDYVIGEDGLRKHAGNLVETIVDEGIQDPSSAVWNEVKHYPRRSTNYATGQARDAWNNAKHWPREGWDKVTDNVHISFGNDDKKDTPGGTPITARINGGEPGYVAKIGNPTGVGHKNGRG